MSVITFVYIAERDGALKIGWSATPRRRARVQSATSLGYTLGSRDDERALHARFDAHALGHEWFEDVPAIRALAAEWGMPEVPKSSEDCPVVPLKAAAAQLGLPAHTLWRRIRANRGANWAHSRFDLGGRQIHAVLLGHHWFVFKTSMSGEAVA